MTISLYDISVATYQQVLGAVDNFMEKGAEYCNENGISVEEIVETQLHDDMRPFRYQIFAVALHSLATMKALETGVFPRPTSYPTERNYAELHQDIKERLDVLSRYTPETVNAWTDNEVVLKLPHADVPFTASNYVLSFSYPNLYFHATTAYDIFRFKGAPFNKRDFIGMFRLKAT